MTYSRALVGFFTPREGWR